jgi:hypothetical protein
MFTLEKKRYGEWYVMDGTRAVGLVHRSSVPDGKKRRQTWVAMKFQPNLKRFGPHVRTRRAAVLVLWDDAQKSP